MQSILERIARLRPKREIKGDNDEPYLDRYYLFHLGPAEKPWMVAYLHKFLASDPDRGLHDHPWPWAVSWILAGRYREQTRNGTVTRSAGSLAWFGRGHWHRVVVDQAPVWTLFMHGPWRFPWGFWRQVQFADFITGHVNQWNYQEYAATSSAGWWKKV